MAQESHTDFAGAFGGPQLLRDGDGHLVQTRIERIGELALPSGTVAVGDPLTGMVQLAFGDAPPVTALTIPARVGAAPLPVELCVARFDDGDERVACARLSLGRGPAARWEDTGAGAGVDSGHAGFTDGASLARWDDEAFLNWLTARVEQLEGAPTWSAWCGTVDETPLALFSSGLGDGFYGAFWGWTSEDELTELVLDFDLLETGDVVDVELDLGQLGRGGLRHPLLDAAGVTARVPWLALGMRLELRWREQSAYARWKLPHDRYQRLRPRSMGQHRASYDLASPPAGAVLSIAVVRRWIPMPPGDGSSRRYR